MLSPTPPMFVRRQGPSENSSFDPLGQTFTISTDGESQIPIPVPMVDEVLNEAIAISINYASQIGACLVMLLVVLLMTTKNRLTKKTTLINIAGLVVGTIRSTLLVLYFTSSYLEFYTFFSQDFTYVNPKDTRISIVATFLAAPQLVLIECALTLQAYSMIQLWRPLLKWPTLFLSALLAILAVGFKCATVAIQIKAIAELFDLTPFIWVRKCDLAFGTSTIFWFCLIFMLRLLIHMWENRSILPTAKGLCAMEMLVMTNGVLLIIPVIFASLEFVNLQSFEAGSLTLTSVIVVLPLGTLVAQRLATKSNVTSQQSKSSRHKVSETDSKRRFLSDWSHRSTDRKGSEPSTRGVTSTIRAGMLKKNIDPVDLELQRIDDADHEGGIWVGRDIEQHEERHP